MKPHTHDFLWTMVRLGKSMCWALEEWLKKVKAEEDQSKPVQKKEES